MPHGYYLAQIKIVGFYCIEIIAASSCLSFRVMIGISTPIKLLPMQDTCKRTKSGNIFTN